MHNQIDKPLSSEGLNEPPVNSIAQDIAVKHFKEGLKQQQQGKYKKSLDLLQYALTTASQGSDSLLKGKIYAAIAAAYYRQRHYLWVLEPARKALHIARSLDHACLQLSALDQLGNSYRHLNDIEKALVPLEQSYRLAEAMGYRKAMSRSLNNLGLAHKANNNYVQAIRCYQQSLTLAQAEQNLQSVSQILRNIGNLYHRIGDYENTIHYYSRLVEAPNFDKPAVLKILRSLSTACYALGRHSLAVQYLKQRLQLAQELKDLKAQEQSLDSLSINHEALGQTDCVIDYQEQRLQVCLALQNCNLQQQALNVLKTSCLAAGDFDRILKYQHLMDG